jgi:hypothetical protein
MDAYNRQLLDEIPPDSDCRKCIDACNNDSSCNVADKCFEREDTDGIVEKIDAAFWSKSANSTLGRNADLSTWGTTVTPTFGRPYATNTPNDY